ncbi:ABC transporter permease [Foetidibacter luteolus]|uniref:ABC transporter permease n=1 Tax=Foetidibacter luteolus TaxID=2608880 RepID=UPI00129B4D7E|nr:ABC transporter permease [Foetidibacter luteolus]
MFRNYLKTAVRSLLRNKSYLLINISGLATGIAVCLAIFVVIQYELSFDEFHSKKDRIYRVLTKGEKDDAVAAVPAPLPTALKNDFPQLEQVAGVFGVDNLPVLVMDAQGNPAKKFKEKSGVFLAEPSFFKIFDFPWLAGNATTALAEPKSVVLTRKTADKYFSDWKKAIGQQIKIDNHVLLKVTGVLADVPPNTDFQVTMVMPYSFLPFVKSTDWVSINSNHKCYVLLPKGATAEAFSKPLIDFSRKYRAADSRVIQLLQPVRDSHFDEKAGNYLGKTISKERIRTLWLIAAFILLIACVNFINLSTAQAVNRAKEVGVRKVLGSSRYQLKKQFLLETFLLVLSSVMMAVALVALILQPINLLLDISLSISLLQRQEVLFFLVTVTTAVTLLAGFYPALVLAGYNPVTALKSKFTARSNKGITLRRGLVVFQFVIAQALIIGTMLIAKQMNYFRNGAMGFNKDALVNIPFQNDSAGTSKIDYLRNRLLQMKGVSMVSFNSQSPSDVDNWWTGFKFDHATKDVDFAAISKFADADYVATYQLPLVAGRSLTRTDSVREFLVNEALVNRLQLRPAEVLNKEIDLWDGRIKGLVVGVIKDFNAASFKDSISPVFVSNVKRRYNTASVKITGTGIPATVKSIERLWNSTFPENVFEYQFMDEKVASFYKQEAQLSKLYTCFAAIAIFLSCLGLYGLASFMAVQRLKEVGIRKILGATAGNIVYLFSREFILLITIAFVIACPLTWYFMYGWLQNYVYRTSLSWWVFGIAGISAVIIALITVGFKALNAAFTNPVNHLRTE